MSKVTAFKHALVALGKEWCVPGWRTIDPDVDQLGDNAREYMRKLSRARPPRVWTPAEVMEWLFAHVRGKLIYTEDMDLRMEGVVKRLAPPRHPAHADCSGIATWAFFVSGWPDPNGLGYNGTGWTGTMQQHGMRVTVAQAQRNDLVFYPDPWHVGVCVGSGKVISFGHQGGPDLTPIGYRRIGEVRRYPRK